VDCIIRLNSFAPINEVAPKQVVCGKLFAEERENTLQSSKNSGGRFSETINLKGVFLSFRVSLREKLIFPGESRENNEKIVNFPLDIPSLDQ
jgi:hypothetical protein